MRGCIKNVIGLLILAIALLLGGCTELERRGYSAIPQNTPSSWEMSPYGNMRN